MAKLDERLYPKMEDEQTGKPPMEHLLEYPNALAAMSWAAQHGEEKHGHMSWQLDTVREHLGALSRHWSKIGWDGKGVDKESLQRHLAHVMLRAAMAYEVLERKLWFEKEPEGTVHDEP